MSNILLLEPDAILAKTYQTALETLGHKVQWHKSAQTALHSADTNQPDLVLLELQMAEHNGLEFLYEFRSYPEWQDIPVVVLSIVPLSEISNDFTLLKRLGVFDYLYKPSSKLEHIVAAIERFVPAAV